MHPLFQKATGLTETIIAAAIEVHRDKGPGLIESIYEWCLLKELGLFQEQTYERRQNKFTNSTGANGENRGGKRNLCSLLFKSARDTATPYVDNLPFKATW